MAAWGYEFYLLVLKYFQHEKIKFVSPSSHVISFIYHINYGSTKGFPALRKAVITHMKSTIYFHACLISPMTYHLPFAPVSQVDE